MAIAVYRATVITNNVGLLTPENATGADDGVFTTNLDPDRVWSARFNFTTLDSTLGTPLGTQEIRFRVRTSDTVTPGDPEPHITATLYQLTTPIATLFTATNTGDGTTGINIVGSFDASLLADFDSIGVVIEADADPYGMGFNWHCAQVDAVTYTVQYTPPPVGTTIKAWDGTVWVDGVLQRWDGSAWVAAVVKRWNGTAWVEE